MALVLHHQIRSMNLPLTQQRAEKVFVKAGLCGSIHSLLQGTKEAGSQVQSVTWADVAIGGDGGADDPGKWIIRDVTSLRVTTTRLSHEFFCSSKACLMAGAVLDDLHRICRQCCRFRK